MNLASFGDRALEAISDDLSAGAPEIRYSDPASTCLATLRYTHDLEDGSSCILTATCGADGEIDRFDGPPDPSDPSAPVSEQQRACLLGAIYRVIG
jgi:hypothetical protein